MATVHTVYEMKKCGVRFSPPAVIVVYDDPKTKKTRKYVMPVRNFRASSNVNFVAEDLKSRHDRILSNVPIVTVEKMLRIIQEHMKGSDLPTALETVRNEFTVLDDEDLNKLGAEAIRRKKEIMDITFNENQVKPEDPDFIYDKRVEFDDSIEKIPSGWDADQTDDFWN